MHFETPAPNKIFWSQETFPAGKVRSAGEMHAFRNPLLHRDGAATYMLQGGGVSIETRNGQGTGALYSPCVQLSL